MSLRSEDDTLAVWMPARVLVRVALVAEWGYAAVKSEQAQLVTFGGLRLVEDRRVVG